MKSGRVKVFAVWLAMTVILYTIWVASIRLAGHDVAIYVVLYCLILVLFFFIEGVELAYTDLRDKEPDQLDPEARIILSQIRENEHVFYEAREWIAILGVVGVTLLCTLPILDVPWVGHTKNETLRLLFSFAFTSFPLIWLAQGPGKSLARRDSQSFLKLFRSLNLWLILRWTGGVLDRLGLFLPSTLLSRYLQRLQPFSGVRNLPPSNSAFFISALKRYGWGLFELSKDHEIGVDGSTNVHVCVTLIYVAGQCSQFQELFEYDSEIDKYKVTKLESFAGPPLGERIEDFTANLSAIAQGKIPGPEFTPLAEARYYRTQWRWIGKVLEFRLNTPEALPGNAPAYSEENAHPGGSQKPRTVVVHIQFLIHARAGAFKTPITAEHEPEVDSFYQSFSIPCKWFLLRFHADGLAFAEIRTSALFKEYLHSPESTRITKSVGENGGTLSTRLAYPLPGTRYVIEWQLWKPTNLTSDQTCVSTALPAGANAPAATTGVGSPDVQSGTTAAMKTGDHIRHS